MFKKNVAICFFAFSSLVNAAPISVNAHPRDFCNLAADMGYTTGLYKEKSGSCATHMFTVTPTPGKNGLKNNLAYYVNSLEYDKNKIGMVSMILNVNNIKQKSKANLELAKVATSVLKKINGSVPDDFFEVIKKGESKAWKQGRWLIDVKTTIWETGQGQDTRVEFLPMN